MLDIKLLRSHYQDIAKKLSYRGEPIDISPIMDLDEKMRLLLIEVENLQAQRNALSKEIGHKKAQNEDAAFLLQEVLTIGAALEKTEKELKTMEEKRDGLLALLPNIPAEEVPLSPDPKNNVCIKTFGEKKQFDFPFKNHLELNEKLHLFDFTTSAKMSGAGWPLYTNKGAELEWALINYMIDIHRKNGFQFILPPHLVRPHIMFGGGQLPKFKDQLYCIQEEESPLYLIPTAEIALNGLHYDEILDAEALPKKYVSYTPCFRKEAGAAGKQERGLIRMHQFNKVELFCFCAPENSPKMFEEIVSSAEEVLEGLELHYRNMLLVTGDLSFGAAKTVDVEVWLPGQNRYYEVSSVSNCTDFQSRRSKIRARKGKEKPYFIHTLNGSGVATSRLLVAILENNQQKDGSIKIPTVLQKYFYQEISTLAP
ncbi:MAG: serine--tRNA ligase [Parachlamydiales bacterium]|nr:serine--tRNA ligase [Parachlamydiales bacterium]